MNFWVVIKSEIKTTSGDKKRQPKGWVNLKIDASSGGLFEGGLIKKFSSRVGAYSRGGNSRIYGICLRPLYIMSLICM